ncbi:MAG: cyclic nucleotide-binding domain-containing protein [Actinobacteria bacterium]|nr:cyclic nucleotide-binding domain-containing protein [Actinomycetota bacterium]MBV8563635.1 cyclic nucleotide-binding domain-containing protein [Actinomycetota bacterium]
MTTVSAAEIAGIPIFENLDAEQLAQLASWFESKDVSPGVKLAGEGASGYSFFVIAEGEAQVTAAGEEIATLGAGDFFGEMALLGEGRRLATVTTTTPSRVLVLFGTEFRRLQAEHPDISETIEAAMRERAEALPS